MTYSCMRMHTTIGAAAFHFRVRNGIGWCHSAMVARERVEVAVLWEVHGSRTLSSDGRRQFPAEADRVGRSEVGIALTNVLDVLSRLSRLASAKLA